MQSLPNYLTDLISQQKLPSSYRDVVTDYLLELVRQVVDCYAQHREHSDQPLVLGIQGSQGSGKSTCALFIQQILKHEYSFASVVLSIDDFYKTKQDRVALANQVHPLFATRGVPGTHDVQLAIDTLDALLGFEAGQQPVVLPRFDKALDDRAESTADDSVSEALDIIIFEGWFVGAVPQLDDAVVAPINELEAQRDGDGIWRRSVNQSLASEYQALFSYIDRLLVLQAPSFESVFEWRLLQEEKLRASLSAEELAHSRVMDALQIENFISHYQRITEHTLSTLHELSDWTIYLEHDHSYSKLSTAYNSEKNFEWLLASDMDGTLLDHYDYTWQAAKPALRALRARRIPLIINTSKTFDECIGLQAEIGLAAPIVVENGSRLYLPKQTMLAGVNVEDLVSGQDYLDVGDFLVIEFGQPIKRILQVAHQLRAQYDYPFEGFSDWSVEQIADSTGLALHKAQLASNKLCSEPIKWDGTDEQLSDFCTKLAEHSIKVLRGGRYLHLQGDCDKSTPLIWLRKRVLELKNAQQSNPARLKLLCLGDNHNDIAMLENADIAVCVKSPVSEYPEIENKDVIYTDLEGPQGWNRAVLEALCKP
jgi:D-glycerate 3-kinase